jgi:outer membrane receptor protein involved in Fe transport
LTYGLDSAGNLVSMNLYQHEADFGLGPVFQTGHLQNYSASVTGGTAQVRYFASANWEDETGIVDYNWLKGLSTRANLSVMPRSDLTFNLNTAYMRSTTRKWQGFPDDIYRQLLWGGPSRLNTRTRGFVRRTPESFREDVEILARVNRVITGFDLDHRPTSWLTHRLKLGVDVTSEDNSRLVRRSPEGAAGIFGSNSLGRKLVGEVGATVLSADYSGTVSLHPTEALSSATSVGAQYFKRSRTDYSLDGQIFPSPGFETVGSMAVTTSDEDFLENITVGTFVQQEFGWRERVFVTGAVRGDDNSAFGAGFSAAVYPKLSATWVISEEPFWPVDLVSKLRFRSAWGAAGRQPDVFDAPRLYDAVTGPGDQAGVTPSSFGNPDLKPERSEELEVGFDAGFLNDRVEFDYTYYTKVTKDAIVRVPVAPSTGFPGSQVMNIGQLSNWGHEFSLTARLVERPKLGWEVGAQASLLHDRVDEIGPVDFIHVGDTRSASDHREGYPSQSVFFWRILSADLNADGSTTNEMCDGGTGADGLQMGGAPVPCANAPKVYWGRSGNPTWEAGAYTTVTLLGNLRLHVRADGRGGSMFMDNDIAAAATTFTNTSWSNLKDNAVYQAYRKIGREGLALTNAGFVKLRDVSVTYTLPATWLGGAGGSRASITVSGRNLAQLWQEQKLIELPDGSIVPDPPVRDAERRFTVESGTFNQAMVPPLRSVVTTIRWSF